MDLTTEKSSNPKDIIGSDKLPLHLWPAAATAMGSIALLEGALKYGRANWREAGVRSTIYVDACTRHLAAWLEGEEVSPDSGTPHLANALACLAIIVDAQAAGKLIDDRNYNGKGYRPYIDQLTTHVPRLKQVYADKAPKHWTHEDDAVNQQFGLDLNLNPVVPAFRRNQVATFDYKAPKAEPGPPPRNIQDLTSAAFDREQAQRRNELRHKRLDREQRQGMADPADDRGLR